MASLETEPGHWWQDRRVVIMLLLGIVSGIIGNFTGQVKWLGGPASVGIVFGVVIGVYLVTIGVATMVRAAGFALCSVATWMVAYQTAQKIYQAFPQSITDELKLPFVGVVAGVLGAGLLAAAIAALFPFFRRRRLVVRTALMGGAFGLLLWPALMWNILAVLVSPWQAAFAVCFALGFPAVAGEPASEGD